MFGGGNETINYNAVGYASLSSEWLYFLSADVQTYFKMTISYFSSLRSGFFERISYKVLLFMSFSIRHLSYAKNGQEIIL